MKKLYKYAGLALIAIMFLSSIVAIFLQAFYFPSQQTQQLASLPTTNIINYDLSPAQKQTALQKGYTLLIYRYPENCTNCTQQKQLIEEFVNNSQFSGQLFLEELSGAQDNPTLFLTSDFGQDTLSNITQETITESLCRIVSQPPTFCALQQVK